MNFARYLVSRHRRFPSGSRRNCNILSEIQKYRIATRYFISFLSISVFFTMYSIFLVSDSYSIRLLRFELLVSVQIGVWVWRNPPGGAGETAPDAGLGEKNVSHIYLYCIGKPTIINCAGFSYQHCLFDMGIGWMAFMAEMAGGELAPSLQDRRRAPFGFDGNLRPEWRSAFKTETGKHLCPGLSP